MLLVICYVTHALIRREFRDAVLFSLLSRALLFFAISHDEITHQTLYSHTRQSDRTKSQFPRQFYHLINILWQLKTI